MPAENNLDILIFRNELEGISALEIPNLTYEMECVCAELPAYNEQAEALRAGTATPARIMAWSWEAGRRYGLLEALAAIEGSSKAYIDFTTAEIDRARDRHLVIEGVGEPSDLPTNETDEKLTTAAASLVDDANRKTDGVMDRRAVDIAKHQRVTGTQGRNLHEDQP